MRKLLIAAGVTLLAFPAAALAQTSTPGGTAPGAATGAVAGAVVGGPVGAIIGAVAGAAIGTAVDPPERVRTYVVAQEAPSVMLEGDAAVGAGLPEMVELRPIPDYEYTYAVVNGQRVLVDPATRQIVYVLD